MRSDRRQFIAGLTALPLVGALGGCQQTPSTNTGVSSASVRTLPVTTLSERVRVVTGAPGNVVVLASSEGAVLVDSGSSDLAPAVHRSLGGERVRTLFNTHYHADQTGGNVLFGKAGAEIHAHVITKQWLAADFYVPAADRWVKALPKEGVPTKTFRGHGELKSGAERIDYGYLLEAHTRGDAWVFFRDSNVLAAGDVVSPLRDPVFDWFAGGWIGGRADAMDDLLQLVDDQTRIVPAYGAVMTRAELQAERDLIAQLYDLTSEATHKGRSAQDMMNDGLLDKVGRRFQDPARFLYDVAKGLQAHYTNFGGNVV